MLPIADSLGLMTQTRMDWRKHRAKSGHFWLSQIRKDHQDLRVCPISPYLRIKRNSKSPANGECLNSHCGVLNEELLRVAYYETRCAQSFTLQAALDREPQT